jgi:DNA repair photolyase
VLSSNLFKKKEKKRKKMKMKSEKKKKKKKKEKEEKKKKKKNDVLVEQIAASKQFQMQVLFFVKKTSFRSVAKK